MWNYITACLLLSSALRAQTFHYTIKLDDVNNLPQAKYATDPLRNLFKTYPTFNDSLDVFDFSTTVFVDETELVSYMHNYNYNVGLFSYEALKPKGRREEQ